MQHRFISIITGLDALYKDLSIVEPRLLACLDKLGNSQVRELLCRLQVHELEPKVVLQKHIYPILKNAAWKVRTHPAHLYKSIVRWSDLFVLRNRAMSRILGRNACSNV